MGSQKLISAVLVLYAVSIMDGHSIMLEKWNNVKYDFSRKTPLGIIKNTEMKIFTEIITRADCKNQVVRLTVASRCNTDCLPRLRVPFLENRSNGQWPRWDLTLS